MRKWLREGIPDVPLFSFSDFEKYLSEENKTRAWRLETQFLISKIKGQRHTKNIYIDRKPSVLYFF